MNSKQLLVVAFAGAQLVVVSALKAQTATNNETDIQTLEQQMQQMQQRLNVLERQQQESQQAATVAPQPSASLSVGSGGVNFISADSNFVASLHAWVQMDSRTFFENRKGPAGIDGFLLRRARPIFQGTAFHDFDFMLAPEFGGSSPQVVDAYINYHPVPELQLEVGKFKPPLGLEALEPDIYTFFNERSIATDLMPYRSIGAELHGDIFGGVLSYAAGVFNGLPDLTTTTINTPYDNDIAFAGRIFTSPFKKISIAPLRGLGFGVSGSYEHDETNAATAGLTPGYTTDGQQKLFTYRSSTIPDGEHWRISPQGYYYYGPFGIMAEYVVSDQEVKGITAPRTTITPLENNAWEVSGGWVLTGENDSYNGVAPRHPFSFHGGGCGAWQVVGRYEQLHVDSHAFPSFTSAPNSAGIATSASEAHAWSAGVNWYVNNNVRVNLSFSRTIFTGGGASGTPVAQPENVLFTRFQFAF